MTRTLQADHGDEDLFLLLAYVNSHYIQRKLTMVDEHSKVQADHVVGNHWSQVICEGHHRLTAAREDNVERWNRNQMDLVKIGAYAVLHPWNQMDRFKTWILEFRRATQRPVHALHGPTIRKVGSLPHPLHGLSPWLLWGLLACMLLSEIACSTHGNLIVFSFDF